MCDEIVLTGLETDGPCFRVDLSRTCVIVGLESHFLHCWNMILVVLG